MDVVCYVVGIGEIFEGCVYYGWYGGCQFGMLVFVVDYDVEQFFVVVGLVDVDLQLVQEDWIVGGLYWIVILEGIIEWFVRVVEVEWVWIKVFLVWFWFVEEGIIGWLVYYYLFGIYFVVEVDL